MSRLALSVGMPRPHVDVRVEAECNHFPLVILGPSGAGKTTLLECLAGLERPATGRIVWGGETFFDAARRIDIPPEKRRCGYVMQDGALFPHLCVRDNVLFGLPAHGDRQRALRLLEELGIAHLATHRPQAISGGERTRVALARALASDPALLLLDEPFAGLDPATRTTTQHLLREVLATRELPAILVTHDRSEAIAFARWTWLLLGGALVQAGPVLELLRHPATPAAAEFVGTENFVPGTVTGGGEGLCIVRCGAREFQVAGTLAITTPVFVCVRPEDLLLGTTDVRPSSARNAVAARVRSIVSQGPLRRVLLAAEFDLCALITQQAEEELHLQPGSAVIVRFKATAAHLLVRSTSRRA